MTTVRAERGWTADDSDLGARLALIRQRQSWNVKEAALACGLPVQSWRGWERGMRPRDYLTVCRQIARATGADYDWLLDGRRSAPPSSESTVPYASRALTLRDRMPTACSQEAAAA